MLALLRRLGAELGLAEIAVNRQFRLLLDEPSPAACYLLGLNEATHGIADSLLSVVANRSADAVADILTQRASGAGVTGPGLAGDPPMAAVSPPVDGTVAS
jgi:L-ornithine N5-oxygenase